MGEGGLLHVNLWAWWAGGWFFRRGLGVFEILCDVAIRE